MRLLTAYVCGDMESDLVVRVCRPTHRRIRVARWGKVRIVLWLWGEVGSELVRDGTG